MEKSSYIAELSAYHSNSQLRVAAYCFVGYFMHE